MIVDIFIPCLVDQIYPKTGLNMVKLLEEAGCSVNYNAEQTCCGQIAFNNGYWEECKEVGEKLIKEFLNDRYIVAPSTSCVDTIRNKYPELFFNSALHNEFKQIQRNIFEFSDFCVNILKHSNFNATLNKRAVFLNSCSPGVCAPNKEAKQLLNFVNGLEIISYEGQEDCCGFGAGVFAIKNESISVAMAKEKTDAIINVGAELIISNEYTCLIQMQSYIDKHNLPLKTMHLCDVLINKL